MSPHDDRRTILDRALQKRAIEGYRVETRSNFQALIAKRKTASERFASSHLLSHFGGCVTRFQLTVDEVGKLTSREVRLVRG